MKLSAFLILAGALTAHAQAIEILSWDASRGGGYSALKSSAAYAPVRSMIDARFAGSTIHETPLLTSASLVGIDVLWLGVQVDDSASITPLTADEGAALRSFVLAGGKAVLFGENDANNPNSPITNASLFDPFGYGVSGLLNGAQSATTILPADPIMTGPYGSITTVSGNFPGWITAKPTGAIDLMRLDGNAQAFLSYSPAGTLGNGAGSVFVFGDSGSDQAGAISGSQKLDLYANILASPVPEPASMAPLAIGALALIRRRRRA